ncbi:MAG: 4Fe-4S dicluster domain-containing protein [candidate division Zixibacteria bacterium]|nr:4Fe-4S dicluster domain-containing protein [candidate division Zixibacteria bacterium]
MFGLRYLKDVVSLQLDAGKCNGCKKCLQVCPHEVFVVEDKLARIVDRDACMECGACALNCPEGALAVEAGVGCAYAIIVGSLKGIEADCGCGEGESSSCC